MTPKCAQKRTGRTARLLPTTTRKPPTARREPAKTREVCVWGESGRRNGPTREKAGRSVAPRFASWRRRRMVFSRVSSFRLLSLHDTGQWPQQRRWAPGVSESPHCGGLLFFCARSRRMSSVPQERLGASRTCDAWKRPLCELQVRRLWLFMAGQRRRQASGQNTEEIARQFRRGCQRRMISLCRAGAPEGNIGSPASRYRTGRMIPGLEKKEHTRAETPADLCCGRGAMPWCVRSCSGPAVHVTGR